MGKAALILEDGTFFEGENFGASGEVYGEIVFNTSMTGYQEIITDPSYNGQVVLMTYPEIGNYGINPQDAESSKPFAKALVVREYWPLPSNWQSEQSLDEFLKKNGIIGIQGVDTREITRIIRTKGAQKCFISTTDMDSGSLLKKVKKSPGIVGRDLVSEVTCKAPYKWTSSSGDWLTGNNDQDVERKYRVVAYDYGIKSNILRRLYGLGCDVTVVPAGTSAEEILSMNPDGIFLSNGPGDPEPVDYAVENVKKLIGKKPMFGICLGHQIISLALGGRTFKLKFGHRGGNQPVKNFRTGKVEITSQNHGFAVEPESLGDDVEITHVNLNDQTIEGLWHRNYPLFSVQYHPESSPGPHDSAYLFDEFIRLIDEDKS